MILLDGNSEIGAHVCSNLCYFICLGHFIRLSVVTNLFFLPKRPIILHSCATFSEEQSDISTMGPVTFALPTLIVFFSLTLEFALNACVLSLKLTDI